MTRWRTLLVLGLALPLAVAGCGGDDSSDGGVDRDDPEAVARAYVETFYACGERGAGRRWDLEIHDGGETEQSRTQVIAGEQQDGCSPTRTPAIETFRGASSGEATEVAIQNPDACTPERATVVLLKTAQGWAVDEVREPSDGSASLCVRNGST